MYFAQKNKKMRKSIDKFDNRKYNKLRFHK